MCISINRWFLCPLLTQPNDQQPPESDPPSDPSRPWRDWKHDDVAPKTEVHRLNLCRFENFTYVRHLHKSTIRCAVTIGRFCEDYPQQTCTELYAIACPTCTKDDVCVLSQPPFHVYREEHILGYLGSDIQTKIVENYFADLCGFVVTLLDVELDDLPIKRWTLWLHHVGSMCTQNSDHIVDGSSGYSLLCSQTECSSTYRSWSHNISRAARIHDSRQLRSGRASNWYEEIVKCHPELIHILKESFFGHIPNQQWFALPEEDENVRMSRMVGVLGENIQMLLYLGPTVQKVPGAVVATEEEWRKLLQGRETLAMIIIWYAALDPGLSPRFLEVLMRDHILTILNPFLNLEDYPPNTEFLECHQLGSKPTQELAVRFSRMLQDQEKVERLNSTLQRQEKLLQLLRRNRSIEYKNKSVEQRLASGTASQFALQEDRFQAIKDMPTCMVCAEDFLHQEVQPMHMQIAQMPCCKQPIHFRCFKGTVMFAQRCPYCNFSLEKHLAVGKDHFHWASGHGRLARPEQGGLFHEPNSAQRRQSLNSLVQVVREYNR
ncbi:hypothetical protein B0T10DRAFT_543358 [Thelonectria olida]|uniref:Uncharacterized protein n=1 Tax=Thelonectria olida TaxID=1576542 RepID=A0A9P8WDV2_9HYPO|nr:hypothetical protein B0T10DRAFT_543358 [Thelonectria olida]